MKSLKIATAAVFAASLAGAALAQDTSGAMASPAPSSDPAATAGSPAPMTPSADTSGTNSSATASATVQNTTVTNGPVPDTPENRAKYGSPMSHAGKKTKPAGN